MSDRASMIGLDWGTTSLRAYRIGPGGARAGAAGEAAGILKVADGAFAAALAAAVGDWLEQAPGLPVLAAGMIGSRQGWREVRLRRLPRRPAGAGGRARHGDGTGRQGWSGSCPGWCAPPTRTASPTSCAARRPRSWARSPRGGVAEPTLLRPARHAQQVGLERGRPDHPVRHLHDRRGLRRAGPAQHSRPPDDGRAAPIRRRSRAGSSGRERAAGRRRAGCCTSCSAPAPWDCSRQIPAEGLASYLSGLLIGAEIAAALDEAGPVEVTILGSSTLGPLYAEALAAAGAAGRRRRHPCGGPRAARDRARGRPDRGGGACMSGWPGPWRSCRWWRSCAACGRRRRWRSARR